MGPLFGSNEPKKNNLKLSRKRRKLRLLLNAQLIEAVQAGHFALKMDIRCFLSCSR